MLKTFVEIICATEGPSKEVVCTKCVKSVQADVTFEAAAGEQPVCAACAGLMRGLQIARKEGFQFGV